MLRSLLIAACLFAGPAHAVEPVAEIHGPTEAAPGDLVVLDAKGSEYDKGLILWYVLGSTKYVQFDEKVVFASGTAGDYRFILLAAGVVDDELKAVTAEHVVRIGGGPGPVPPPVPPGPVPPVPPGPVPPPAPPTPPPDGPLGLTRSVYDAAMLVTPTAARSRAAKLADNFEAVASSIAAGVMRDGDAVITETMNANVTSLGEHRAAWQAFFQDTLGPRLDVMFPEGSWDKDKYRAAWIEIAAGLRAASAVTRRAR